MINLLKVHATHGYYQFLYVLESEGECTDEYEYQQVESDTRPTNAVMKRPATSADSGGAVPAKRHCDEQSQMVKPGAACHIRYKALFFVNVEFLF